MDYLGMVQFDAYASACAGRAGVKVVWDKADSVPRTDGKTIWLPRLTSKTTDTAMTRLRFCIKHETSHIVHSDFDFLVESKVSGLLAMVNNIVEDYRVDFRNDMEYKGDIAVSEAFYQWYAEYITSNADNESLAKLAPIFMWDASHRTYVHNAALVVPVLRSVISSRTEAQEQFAKLMSGTYGEELLALCAIDDKREAGVAVLALARRIVDEVFTSKSEEQEEPEEVPQDSKGTAKGKGEGESEEDGITEADILEVEELLSAPHKPAKSDTGIRFIGEHDTRPSGWILPAPSDYVVIRGKDMPERLQKYAVKDAMPTVLDIVEQSGRPLANHLRIKLQTRSKDRYESGKRKGKLHTGSLHRILSGDAKQAERVFKQRIISNTLDTAVLVLVDCSGSMGGSKYKAAAACAGTIAEALGPLHMTHSVLGFTCDVEDEKEAPLMRWFKDWNENIPSKEVVARFGQLGSMLHQNADGDSVVYAYHALMQRKETRKVLIVLSDGSPCGRDWAGNGSAYLKSVTSKIERDKQVDLYGIGILDDNVKHYYTKNSVLNDVGAIIPTVINVLNVL